VTHSLADVDVLERYRAARKRVLPDCPTADERADLLVAVLWPTPVNGNGSCRSVANGNEAKPPGIWRFVQLVLFPGGEVVR
jgi:hypothetical protein